MISDLLKISRRDAVMVLVLLCVCCYLFFLDIAPKNDPEPGSKEKARVLNVDDTGLIEIGLVKHGSQVLEVEVLSGEWKGHRFRAVNQLRAQMDLDKKFQPGDTILVGILDGIDPETGTVNAQDHYRLDYTILLFTMFTVLLLLFGGITGFNALLSFVFACLLIWKIVIPLCLEGWNPIIVCFTTATFLCAIIIFLVAGLSKKGVVAFSGSFLGILASSAMAYLFVNLFKVNGAVMPFAETLLHSGYENLSLSEIYIGAIFLSSSGAVMDLGMDVSAGMNEVAREQPGISRFALLRSGLRMGRAVVGTMTTTLLLAYSGGYLTMLMMFAAQGTSPIDFINNPYIASETVKTLIGSFGLVLVAPLTALIGSFVFHTPKRTEIDSAI